MKTTTTTPADSTSHAFLTGAILFANLDYSGLAAYAVKAAIGGAIWMVFKLAGDLISHKLIQATTKKNIKPIDNQNRTEEQSTEKKED